MVKDKMTTEEPQKRHKSCFVPLCNNTTRNAPNKVFVNVPQEEKLRRKWFGAVRRDNLKLSKSTFACCEDHFDLQEDMQNYLYYKTMGGPVKMKKNVVPHKFECQPDRKRRTCSVPRNVAVKRQRLMELKEIFADEAKQSTSRDSGDISEQTTENIIAGPANISELQKTNVQELETTDSCVTPPTDQTATLCETANVKTPISLRSIGIQVKLRPHFRSVHTMCHINPPTKDQSTSPIKPPVLVDLTNSPNKVIRKKQCFASPSTATTSTSIGVSSSGDHYVPSNEASSKGYCSSPVKNSAAVLNVTNFLISTNMKAYLGIPNEWAPLINSLSTMGNISIIDIQLCLLKIRRQDTFERLGEQFCMSTSNASLVFSKTVPILSYLLKALIFFPESKWIKKSLPIAFRNSCSNVKSIVDALEIQIEKPSDAVNQALTWSEYKKCNTLKYLISCGPSGFINFISTGYGGRISDVLLFEQCGILEKLPEKCAVMADRGFKNIKSLLSEKNFELIKPPSVSSNVQPTKSEVLETKRIASLRIHVERVIGRLREFDFLKPHAVINHSMLSYTDDIIVIAAALVNLHSQIIKK